MTARKRGPGRPALPKRQHAVTTSLRLRPEDRARLDRLSALWGHERDSDTWRHALEVADLMTREPT